MLFFEQRGVRESGRPSLLEHKTRRKKGSGPMIYTAEEFGSADIMDEMGRKLERLNRIVAAYCCSQNEPTMELD